MVVRSLVSQVRTLFTNLLTSPSPHSPITWSRRPTLSRGINLVACVHFTKDRKRGIDIIRPTTGTKVPEVEKLEHLNRERKGIPVMMRDDILTRIDTSILRRANTGEKINMVDIALRRTRRIIAVIYQVDGPANIIITFTIKVTHTLEDLDIIDLDHTHTSPHHLFAVPLLFPLDTRRTKYKLMGVYKSLIDINKYIYPISVVFPYPVEKSSREEELIRCKCTIFLLSNSHNRLQLQWLGSVIHTFLHLGLGQ
jgi:hypothetical protein